jgi:hypothetical protein
MLPDELLTNHRLPVPATGSRAGYPAVHDIPISALLPFIENAPVPAIVVTSIDDATDGTAYDHDPDGAIVLVIEWHNGDGIVKDSLTCSPPNGAGNICESMLMVAAIRRTLRLRGRRSRPPRTLYLQY